MALFRLYERIDQKFAEDEVTFYLASGIGAALCFIVWTLYGDQLPDKVWVASQVSWYVPYSQVSLAIESLVATTYLIHLWRASAVPGEKFNRLCRFLVPYILCCAASSAPLIIVSLTLA